MRRFATRETQHYNTHLQHSSCDIYTCTLTETFIRLSVHSLTGVGRRNYKCRVCIMLNETGVWRRSLKVVPMPICSINFQNSATGSENPLIIAGSQVKFRNLNTSQCHSDGKKMLVCWFMLPWQFMLRDRFVLRYKLHDYLHSNTYRTSKLSTF